MSRALSFAILISTLMFATGTRASDAVQQAQVFLAKYTDAYRAYDPAVADLYSDDALIQNTRTYPTGEVRKLSMPAPQYKALLRQTMTLAQQRGDRSQYMQASYTETGAAVRIQLTRYSELKRYTSPLVLVVAPDKNGQWLVREEISESIP